MPPILLFPRYWELMAHNVPAVCDIRQIVHFSRRVSVQPVLNPYYTKN
jgi:hypothetical protein